MTVSSRWNLVIFVPSWLLLSTMMRTVQWTNWHVWLAELWRCCNCQSFLANYHRCPWTSWLFQINLPTGIPVCCSWSVLKCSEVYVCTLLFTVIINLRRLCWVQPEMTNSLLWRSHSNLRYVLNLLREIQNIYNTKRKMF